MKRVLSLGSRASRSLLPLLFACIFLAITRAQAQAPVIDTQPQKQSVASGATATFSVSVSGAEPLAYQWQLNGTNILGSTNQTLVLTNVQPRQYGEVLVVITNSFGSITSAVAELRVDEQLSFRIVSLLTNGIIATEASSQISDDKGGIAVSSLNVFVTGGEGNGDRARTGRFPIDTLTGGTSLATGFDSLICNLKTETVYSLGNGSTPIQFLNFSITHSNVNSLLEIDPGTGTLTGNRINLSTNIFLPTSQYGNIGLFAGYDRIVIHNAQRVYSIALPSGKVTDLGAMSATSHNFTEGAFCYWGMAEYWRGNISLVYVQDSANVARTRVPDGHTSTVLNLPDFPNFGSMASICFSISRSRWYAHVEGTTFLGSRDETVGSAKAAYIQDAGYPTISLEPADQVSYPSSNVTFTVRATGDGPFYYQWFKNGAEIPDATEATLSLSNIDESDEAYYNVEVGNLLGLATSRQAFLTVYSVPEIVSNPLSRSVFPGTNVLFSVEANAAPPVSYSWRFNGQTIPGATNFYLLLTNVQPANHGMYSVQIVNRFGSVTSEEAELNVVVPIDDGTVFQITSLGSNNFRVVDTYPNFGYSYGPFAVGDQNVFFSTSGNTAYADTETLANSGYTGNFFAALISNLRSEKVYALGGAFPMDYNGGTASTLIEIDGRTGATTTNRITLSSPIPIGFINSQIGFFSGYGRAIILNGARAYQIMLPSGVVTDLGPMYTPFHPFSFSGAFWGVLENREGVSYLVYSEGSRSIVRTRVPDGDKVVLAGFSNLSSYMASMSVSIPRGRWYFQHLFSSQFANSGNSIMGFAPATFAISSGTQADRFEWDPIGPLQLANQPIPVTLRAKTSSNLIASNYNGTVSLTGIVVSNGTPTAVSPAIISGFVNGVWSGSVTVQSPNAALFLRATDRDDIRGDSTVFSANPTNDLVLQVSDSPDPALLGQPVTYAVTLTNTGPLTIPGVIVTNALATNILIVSYNSTLGGCTQNGNTIVCSIGNLAVGDIAQISIVGRGSSVGQATNRFTAVRSGADPNPNNNSAVELTSIMLPSIRIQDISVIEGDFGTNDVAVPVYLSGAWTNTISVSYSTANASAISVPPNHDFLSRFGVLTFPPGIVTQYVMVPIRGDTLYESNEVFFVNLANATNAVIADNQAICTIVNDDPMPVVSMRNAIVREGNTGTTNALIQIRLSTAAGTAVNVQCATFDGTALAGSDYAPRTLTMTFPANATTLTQNFNAQIFGDTLVESNEFFYVKIIAITNAIASRDTAVCVILNNDGAGQLQHFKWENIPTPSQTNTPLSVTITAKDIFGNTVTNFTNSVSLSAGIALHQEQGTLLGNPSPQNSFSGQSYTLGYYFSPTTNIVVTHVRSYTGVKVTIWSQDGTLLASQAVPNYDGFWVETPLATPLSLAAGSSNIVAMLGDNNDFYYSYFPAPPTFEHGVFGPNAYTVGDGFPNQTYTGERYFVDLAYTVGPPLEPVSMSPANSGQFTNGVWSGEVMVLSMATNVQLIAQDTNRHAGRSNPFDAGYIPPMDSDGDGMWDDWELAHGLNPFDPSDALQDSDGDGRTNLDEFRTGGDPQVADSVTRVIGVQISGQEVRIALDGIRLGNRYALERRDSFVSGPWTIVQEFIGGPDPEVELTDSWDASGNAPHVYRLRFVHE